MAIETIDIAAIFGSIGVILSLSACVAGVGYRTWAKYHDKVMSGEVQAFDRKFFYQALVAFGGAIVVSLPLVTAGVEMINQWAGSVGLLIAWFMTAGWAYAVSDGTNGIVKLVEKKAVMRAVKSGQLDNAIKERIQEIRTEEGSKPVEQPVQPVSSQPAQGENTPQSNQPVS